MLTDLAKTPWPWFGLEVRACFGYNERAGERCYPPPAHTAPEKEAAMSAEHCTPVLFPAATVARFWAKVRKDPDGCWRWTASLRHKGYGAFVWHDPTGREVQGRAHRFSWELHFGPIPDGMKVLHSCDNPPCCNPDHLFLGTIADNNRDMCAKGRHVAGGTYKQGIYGPGDYRRGTEHHAAKLDEAKVLLIRAAVEDGRSLSDVGREFGINASCVWKIAHRKAWAHVDGHPAEEGGARVD